MSIPYALVVLLDSVFSASLYAWAIALEITSGIMIVLLVAALLYKGLANWRDKAVQRALNAESEQQFEAQICADLAKEEERSHLQAALHSVWDEVNRLEYALHGTTQQIEDDLWEISHICGTPMPSLVLPESHRPFHVELSAIARSLMHLGFQLGNARVKSEDLDFYQKWVEELWARFRLFELRNNNQQRRLQSRLSGMRDLHATLGKEYCLATINPVYQSFSGMLHIVEMMIDDNSVPAEQMSAYVAALAQQLSKLAVSFECKRYGLRSDEDSLLHLLLASGMYKSK